jgi:hypothetical protein
MKGELRNSMLIKRLEMLARDLVVYGGLIRRQFLHDLDSPYESNTYAARYR